MASCTGALSFPVLYVVSLAVNWRSSGILCHTAYRVQN